MSTITRQEVDELMAEGDWRPARALGAAERRALDEDFDEHPTIIALPTGQGDDFLIWSMEVSEIDETTVRTTPTPATRERQSRCSPQPMTAGRADHARRPQRWGGRPVRALRPAARRAGLRRSVRLRCER